jgi:dethiobiotin synthetase
VGRLILSASSGTSDDKLEGCPTHVSRILFITGTDTGVGKTLLTASLLYQLRQEGVKALAIKPFCSGGMGDVTLLGAIQGGELSAKEINPFHFPEPTAPLIGARRQGFRIELADVLGPIRSLLRKTDWLLVEGAGGLLSPLGEQFSLVDIMVRLSGEVILVGPNKLGVLNHTLLTVEAMRARGIERIQVVLMGQPKPDDSARTNPETLREMLAPMEIISLPYLGPRSARLGAVKKNAKKIKKTLALILSSVSVSPRSLERLVERRPRQNG